MWYQLYTVEKLRELEEERLARRSRHPRPVPRPLLAPVLRRAGRALRRFGEALECWGTPCPERAADGELA